MECRSENSAQEVEFLLGKINKLLEENDEPRWAAYGRELLDNFVHLTHSKTKKEAAIAIKRALTGAMGSFGDIVLYKDGKILNEENDEIRELWDLLLIQCELIQYERLSARKAATFTNGEYDTFEVDMDDYYIFYRESSNGEPMGMFFMDDPVVDTQVKGASPLPLPLQPTNAAGGEQKIYRLKIPKGTLVRCGNIAVQEGIPLKAKNQVYVEKPWHVLGLKISPVETQEGDS